MFSPSKINMMRKWLFVKTNLLGTWSVSHGQESNDWDFTIIDRRAWDSLPWRNNEIDHNNPLRSRSSQNFLRSAESFGSIPFSIAQRYFSNPEPLPWPSPLAFSYQPPHPIVFSNRLLKTRASMLFHKLHCFTNPVVCQGRFWEAHKKCFMALLITHLPTGRQGFQKRIPQVFLNFRWISYLENRSLPRIIGDFSSFPQISFHLIFNLRISFDI